MCLDDKYNLLPIIDISDDSLFYIDTSKERTKINSLVNKRIIYELWDKENRVIEVIPGKLLEIKDEYLFIKNDYGFEEEISINNIRGIEEYTNNEIFNIEQYIKYICEITGRNEKVIRVLIVDYDEFEILFHYKYMKDNKECIGESSIPVQLIKSIKIIQHENREDNFTNYRKLRFPDSLKNITNFVSSIKGETTKICHIKGKHGNVVLNGEISDINIIPGKEINIIIAKLDDTTGNIDVIILDRNGIIENKIKNRNMLKCLVI